jgi:hypothetical protein
MEQERPNPFKIGDGPIHKVLYRKMMWLIVIIGSLLFIYICYTISGSHNKKITSTKVEIEKAVATEIGWVKTISQPILVVSTNNETFVLKQVEFRIGDGPIHTALFDLHNAKCWYKNWEIGDEIFVVKIPGMINDTPTPTFFAVNHRSSR